MTSVLSRSRLSTGYEIITGQRLAGTTQSRGTHALYHIIVGLTVGFREMTTGEERIKGFSLNLPYHMRHVIITSVGDRRTEIGNLKRRQQHLTLSDGNRDDGQTIPRTLIRLIIELGIRNQTTFLSRKVDAQLITKSHADHIVAPDIHRILYRTVFRDIGIDHMVESPTEETVTRCTQGGYDGQWGGVTVTADMQTFEVEAMSAGVRRRGSDDTFGKEGQTL